MIDLNAPLGLFASPEHPAYVSWAEGAVTILKELGEDIELQVTRFDTPKVGILVRIHSDDLGDVGEYSREFTAVDLEANWVEERGRENSWKLAAEAKKLMIEAINDSFDEKLAKAYLMVADLYDRLYLVNSRFRYPQ